MKKLINWDDSNSSDIFNSSNRLEYHLSSFHRSNQDTFLINRPSVKEGDWVQPGDLLADCSSSIGGELSLGQNILIAYMPWEGYNYEDAILINERLVFDDLYTSIHIEKYDLEIRETKFGFEQITKNIPHLSQSNANKLDHKGIIKKGCWVQEGDVLVGKVTPLETKFQSSYQKLLYTILEKEFQPVKDSSLRVPKGLKARVIDIQYLKIHDKKKNPKVPNLQCINVYLAEKRRIQVGDKVAGRHGNKGIISRILPRYDMPYLPDGTPVDMVLNPLGVPSRMNVGQIYECLLGLAGKYLGERYKIFPFDESYGAEASRSLVYSKLYEAKKKTGQNWLFNPNYPGKLFIFDGRTGDCFDQAITVGYAYILKLVHLVDDKIHSRSIGPYSLVTQQPLKGRSKQGGQRLGEMEVWALEAYGAAFILLEMLTLKSDDITGRMTLWSNILLHKDISIGTPESFKVLICELQALCLDIGLFRLNSKGLLKQIDHLLKLP
uniref:DNA-directed RNA polymerase n=1 Tax=Treubaria triappendiculata TaxID=1755147 RepID=A0A0S2LMF8_TRETR|nr:beta subunit of RNA polymerase [Treubaria triappendiculata]ALO62676.1 beta subunit of RNA polymerase [Treubaria triappendiculata]